MADLKLPSNWPGTVSHSRKGQEQGLLLARHACGADRCHDGRVAVLERDTGWRYNGLEIGCENGERVRVAFLLDCCDREAMSYVGTTGSISGDHVRDPRAAAVEHTRQSAALTGPIFRGQQHRSASGLAADDVLS